MLGALVLPQVFGVFSLANDRFGALPILLVIIGPLGLLLIAPGF